MTQHPEGQLQRLLARTRFNIRPGGRMSLEPGGSAGSDWASTWLTLVPGGARSGRGWVFTSDSMTTFSSGCLSNIQLQRDVLNTVRRGKRISYNISASLSPLNLHHRFWNLNMKNAMCLSALLFLLLTEPLPEWEPGHGNENPPCV